MDQPVALAAGDCYVLAHGTPYVLRDHPNTPTVSCASVIRDRIGGVVELGGTGTAASVICGWFHFDQRAARPLLDLLPVLLHVKMEQARALALQGTLQLLAMETGEPGLGSGLLVSRLADIVFVQAVRAHVAASSDSQTGWLAALAGARLDGGGARLGREPLALGFRPAVSRTRGPGAAGLPDAVAHVQGRQHAGPGQRGAGHHRGGGGLRIGGCVQQGLQAREGHGARGMARSGA
jgi:hypothetical protein